MPKMAHAADVMYKKRLVKAENIYLVPIYMYSKLTLGRYSPHIYLYIAIQRFAYKAQPLYIYKLESKRTRLNLSCANQ